MDICFFSETAAWGGAEIHTVELAQMLAERGHAVQIVALDHDVFDEFSRRPEAHFKIHRVRVSKPVSGYTWRECADLMRSLPAGVGVLVRFGLAVGSLRLDLAARRHFRRWIVIEHSAAVMPPRTSAGRHHLFGLLPGVGLWWYQERLLWFLRSMLSHRMVCVSNAARQRLIRDFHVAPRKVVTIYDGIDATKFRPNATLRSAARRQWGLPDDAFVFGSVGRLHPEKGLDLAIEGLAQLVERHPKKDLRLVLVGDGPARASLTRLAETYGLAGRVVFAGFHPRPWEMYPGLDVFLLPSQDEALSLALLEAMACGCSAVAMGVGGVPEVLANPALGWLVQPGDRAGFVQAMDATVGLDSESRAAMAQAARKHVADTFDARRQYEALANLIEQDSPVVRTAQPLPGAEAAGQGTD